MLQGKYCFEFNVILTLHHRQYVEIKCQLDATEVFIADLTACSTCFGHHCARHQELMSIIWWLLPVVFRAVVFKLLVWCGAEGCVSGLQDAAYCLLNMFRAPLCPSSRAQEYYTVVAACGISCSNHRKILLRS